MQSSDWDIFPLSTSGMALQRVSKACSKHLNLALVRQKRAGVVPGAGLFSSRPCEWVANARGINHIATDLFLQPLNH